MIPKPEFRAWNPDELAATWQQFGCLLLRKIVPVSLLQPFWQRAQQGYQQADRLQQEGRLPNDFYQSLFRFGHIAPPGLPSSLGSPLPLNRLVLFSALKTVLVAILGPEVALLQYSTLRRQSPVGGNPPVPFHQDAMFLGNRRKALNLWMPLTPCGENHPGLEVISHPVEVLWESDWVQQEKTPTLQAGYDALAIAPERLEAAFAPDDFWHPVMQPGDVLVFSNLTLHRTFLHPAMNQPRISLELRCTRSEWADGFDSPMEHLQL